MNRKTVQQDFAEVIEICENIKAAGYDPVMQIRGYLETGDFSYITRKGDARSKIPIETFKFHNKYLQSD